jgi:uncharacterized damage-inducible protein DinB
MQSQFAALARYNAWANRRLYDACARLSEAAYFEDRRAFFGSIHRTLDHVLLADRLWFGRVAGIASGITTPNQVLYDSRSELRAAREEEDARIIELVDGIDPARLDRDLHYVTMEGEKRRMRLSLVLTDVFNHQTHHRGQIHVLLTQAGVDAPALDLIEHLHPSP